MLRKNILLQLVLFFTVLLPSSAFALPTFFFEGDFDYQAGDTSTPGLLTFNASLTGTQDLPNASSLIGSSLTLQSWIVSDNSTAALSQATFGSTGSTDIAITGTGSSLLFLANVDTLLMSGANSASFGTLTGDILPSGGTLANQFSNPSNLLAIEFNLSSPFSVGMFNRNFSGAVNGSITSNAVSVPEPTTLALFVILLLGLLVITVNKPLNTFRGN